VESPSMLIKYVYFQILMRLLHRMLNKSYSMKVWCVYSIMILKCINLYLSIFFVLFKKAQKNVELKVTHINKSEQNTSF